MKSKRKPKQSRTRRSTFESSLEYATAKLDKCLSRRVVLEAELESLTKEIPYLQTVIRALTPRPEDPKRVSLLPRPPHPPRTVSPLPADIRQFVEPISDNVDELPDEADKFLDGSKLPPGEDLLS